MISIRVANPCSPILLQKKDPLLRRQQLLMPNICATGENRKTKIYPSTSLLNKCSLFFGPLVDP